MLTIKSLSVAYGNRTILENVHMEFKRGTITVIKGESGSGKSSLLNVLGLMQTALGCEYTFDDLVVSKFNDIQRADFRLNNIGFVFQQSNLVQELTAKENLILPMSITSQIDLEKKADELIKYVGLEDVKNDYPGSMSGGEEQRLAIARAIANDADIILADEPTASLDASNSKMVLELFQKLARELNKIVIVVSHTERVSKYADVTCEIKGKKLIVTKSAVTKVEPHTPIASRSVSKKRKTMRFIRYYSKKRSCSKALNGVFIAVTALVATTAMLSTSFGGNLVNQQSALINAISDRSIFVVNDTLGLNSTVDYEHALAIPDNILEQITAIPGVSNVYPWYTLSSSGWDPDDSTVFASIKVIDGETVISEKGYSNPAGRISPNLSLSSEQFFVCPLYDEEEYSFLLEYKGDSDTMAGLIITQSMARQLSANPAELIDKMIEISCFVPTKLFDSVVQKDGATMQANNSFCKLITIEGTISGVLYSNYSLQRAYGNNFIFMNYNQLLHIINENKDLEIEERFPGFPERELGPSAMVVFADTYEDVSEVTSSIKTISASFNIVSHLSDIAIIKNSFSATKRTMAIATTVFVCIVIILFGLLYFQKNHSRKKEFGILKAIGLTKNNIAVLTFVEMLKLTVPAFIAAVALSILLSSFMNGLLWYDVFSISTMSGLLGFLVCISVVVLSGMIPAYAASRVDPIEAIRKTRY